MKRKYKVNGMTCAACQAAVEREVNKLDLSLAQVSLLTNTLEVEGNASDKEIKEAVEKAGYQLVTNEEKKDNIYQDEVKDLRNRLYVSIPLLLILMYIAMGDMVGLPIPSLIKGYEGAGLMASVQLILTLPILYVNRAYFKSGFKALIKRHPNMDTLVALGAASAIIYGIFAMLMINRGQGLGDHNLVHKFLHDLYFETGATILTLITLGKYLETKSKAKTSDAINKLMDLQEEDLIVIRDGKEVHLAFEDILVGDQIKVLPGQKIVVDGSLIEGSSYVDTSAITGESMPIEVAMGDKVISGSINQTGSFIMQADKVGSDTTISKIISLMEEASATKAPISQMADRISLVFVPIVIGLAILSFIFWMLVGNEFTFAFSIAIGVLVISCPCALGLATPVAMMVANGKAAENGILVKNAQALEDLSKIKAIVFDKTGTITRGRPNVTDIISFNGFDKTRLISIANALEARSEHPLGQAIIRYAEENEIDKLLVEDFESITGKGIKGIIDNQTYYIGNLNLLKENTTYSFEIKDKLDNLASQGKTPVVIFDNRQVLGIIGISDPIKESSLTAIKEIEDMGIETYMLTGDNQITAKAIGDQVNIDNIRSDLLPQDKDKIIEEIKAKGYKVAMVGDGINDAPSLVRADVGIAIGAGTDIAIESADLVLVKSDLIDIVSAIALSKETIKTIKSNLFWAFFYNVLAIPLAMGIFYPAFGLRLNPMIGALAMSLSSVFVVTNSLRLNRFKLDKASKEEVYDNNILVKYDNIELSENTLDKESTEDNMKKLTLNIDGMSCLHCKMAVEKALKKYDNDAEVFLDEKIAKIKVNSDEDIDNIVRDVEDLGYKVVSTN